MSNGSSKLRGVRDDEANGFGDEKAKDRSIIDSSNTEGDVASQSKVVDDIEIL